MSGELPCAVAGIGAGHGGPLLAGGGDGRDVTVLLAWRGRPRRGSKAWRRPALGAVLACAACLVAHPGSGAEPETEEASAFNLQSIGLKGSVTYKNYSQFHEVLNDKQVFVNQGILELEWGHRLTSWSSIKLVGEGLLDDANYARGLHFGVPDVSTTRSILGLKEGVLRLHSDTFEVTL